MSDENIKIKYIARSLSFAKCLGEKEGYFPLKHIGISITNGGNEIVYHAENTSKLAIIGGIKISTCNFDAFADGQGVGLITEREIDKQEQDEIIKQIYERDGDIYVMALWDCERVATSAFRKKYRWFFHRQFWLLIIWVIIYQSTRDVFRLLYTKSSEITLLDKSIYALGILGVFVFFLFFFLKLNNTSKNNIA